MPWVGMPTPPPHREEPRRAAAWWDRLWRHSYEWIPGGEVDEVAKRQHELDFHAPLE